jgi:hypothetical protein
MWLQVLRQLVSLVLYSVSLEYVLTTIRHYSLPCKASECNRGSATEGRGECKGHRDTRSHDGASAGTLKCSGTQSAT